MTSPFRSKRRDCSGDCLGLERGSSGRRVSLVSDDLEVM